MTVGDYILTLSVVAAHLIASPSPFDALYGGTRFLVFRRINKSSCFVRVRRHGSNTRLTLCNKGSLGKLPFSDCEQERLVFKRIANKKLYAYNQFLSVKKIIRAG